VNRRYFLQSLAFGATGLGLARLAGSASSRKPNFVIILADDLGWTGLGCFGSRYYETPNLNRLCAQGMKFTDGYADAPVCAPTRACLISGQYTPRTGVYRVSDMTKGKERFCPFIQPKKTPFGLDKTTIAEALKQLGYATAHFGKWHLGPKHPSEHGFDVAIESSGRHFDPQTKPQMDVPKGTYLTDFLADHALRFIEQNKARPFFLYFPDFLVHKPHEAKEQLIKRFKEKMGTGAQSNPVYAAMTYSLDVTVGRIVKKIDDLGLAGNTLIVFLSDNGGRCVFGPDLRPKSNSFTDNLPLREGKGELYEGGIRVPYVFRWPGRIKPGTVCHEPVTTVDLYPTLVELAGGTPDPQYPLDGISVVPCLHNHHAALNRDALYWYYPNFSGGPGKSGKWAKIPRAAIRARRYKLIEYLIEDRPELYDLENDIGETQNLAGKMPAKVEELRTKLRTWMKAVGAPEMLKNVNFNPGGNG
jgi:arylsulfatase A-like enzyme